MIDTVDAAKNSPEKAQPYAALGLRDEEYENIRQILGRRPTASELAMYSVMWSEHCSYKSSKIHLKQFGEKKVKSDVLLVGIGENAGVVDIGQGYAVTFKVESHNHPSFVEPYQGAATGVGGIVRDILTMGARPIAVMDPLRFGKANHPDTARVLPGIVAGIGGYGNCLGLPNIGGEIFFDDSYQGNPLVNALCVGVMKHEDIKLAKATGAGNLVVLFGAKTGGDGIGGVSVLASESFGGKASKRPSVQVGDPFAEKVLIEACLEIFQADLVIGIQDLGGAGLSCATSELASAGSGGMEVELDKVPLRDPSLSPEEILMSESQERMCAIVEPAKIDRFLALCKKWDVTATVIGRVTDGTNLKITYHGELIVDVPPRTVAHDGPVYSRQISEPKYLAQLKAVDGLPNIVSQSEIQNAIEKLIGSPNIADKSWVTSQYDKYVQGNTVLAYPEDAGMIRIDEITNLGIAISTDCNSRFVYLNPYRGVQQAVAESCRNIAVSGAKPIALTNCLNFGSPEDPEVMWQFKEAVTGLADIAVGLGLPVTGGNVSFYNQTGSQAILPTPVIGTLGTISDVTKRTPSAFQKANQTLVLIGETKAEFSGSEWAALHNQIGNHTDEVNFNELQKEIYFLLAVQPYLSSAHDLSNGGLIATLVEASINLGLGFEINTTEINSDLSAALFAETPGRSLLAIDVNHLSDIEKLAKQFDQKISVIGETTTNGFKVNGLALDQEAVIKAYQTGLRNIFESKNQG